MSQPKIKTVVDPVHTHQYSVGKFAATIVAVSSMLPSVAAADVINVFQPTFKDGDMAAVSFGPIYILGCIVPYFLFNTFLAPKLGLVKEGKEGDQKNNLPPENKTPF